DKRTNSVGAIVGIIAGLGFITAYIVYFKFITPEANVPDNWLLGISPEGIGVVGMLINFALAIGVSRVTAEPPAEVQELVESIRVPRGAGAAVHIAQH